MALDEKTRAAGSAAVTDRLRRLQRAVAAGGRYFDPFVAARAQDDLHRTQDRMFLGTDLTVVALAGGTGSGKSTLFNAITGLQFADSGELRPTTERAAACIYSADAGALLDYLEVDPSRRINHESMLNADEEPLDGLVLLDLPDHDSVQIGHSVQVERLIPMVDLLVWVVDPQKYADQILHRSYLSALRLRSDSMLVVLNQIDTVPVGSREVLVKDLHKLLATDGLGDVPVLTTSAITGEGVENVVDHIRSVVYGPSATARTAAAELDAIGARLACNIGESEVDLRGSLRDEVIERIAGASGIAAVAEAIRAAGRSLSSTAFSAPEQPGNSMVVAIRDTWMSRIRQGLPVVWGDAACAGVASAERIRRAVGAALRGVELPTINRQPMWALTILGAVFGLAGIVLAIAGIPTSELWARIVVAGSGIFLGGLFYLLGRRRMVAQAVASAEDFTERASSAIGKVVDETMVDEPMAVLDRHKATREALASFRFDGGAPR